MNAMEHKPRQFDDVIVKITDYIFDYRIQSSLAIETARLCLADSLGCAILALNFKTCHNLLGPWVSGMQIDKGARVPGTTFELDPIKAAFDITTLIRWLDFNDTWLAKEWGHPSDNLGAILSVMDFVTRRSDEYARLYTVNDMLEAMCYAYEIQGIIALENSFNAVGLDHVLLVKIASTGIATKLLGGTKDQVMDALSQAWVDGQSLRTYRHAPNTGSRKSWAAGDATSRSIELALLTLKGEKGYHSVLTAPHWGFYDVLFGGKSIKLNKPFETYVMENILFKIAYPAEFHAQTAVECALKLHPKIKNQLSHVSKIILHTHSAAIRIIDKKGPLYNPADRDHCLQYMVAVALVDGKLTADSYEDSKASESIIDDLRQKMIVIENVQYSQDYLDQNKRSIANDVEIILDNGETFFEKCEYPIGHQRRRNEGIPLLWEKFENNLRSFYPKDKTSHLLGLMQSSELLKMTVSDFIDQWL